MAGDDWDDEESDDDWDEDDSDDKKVHEIPMSEEDLEKAAFRADYPNGYPGGDDGE